MVAHENRLRPAGLIFLESLVEDGALGIGKHEVAFLNPGGAEIGSGSRRVDFLAVPDLTPESWAIEK